MNMMIIHAFTDQQLFRVQHKVFQSTDIKCLIAQIRRQVRLYPPVQSVPLLPAERGHEGEVGIFPSQLFEIVMQKEIGLRAHAKEENKLL